MPKTRKSHPPSLKAKVAVEAIKAHKTAAQIAQMFGVHPTQVGGWKKQALAGLPDVFGNGREQMRQQADADKADQTYNQLNFHDDQFDLSDAMLALAISLLAVTALTQKRWLFVLAMFPTVFGVVMGLAGLLSWHIHPDSLTKLLS